LGRREGEEKEVRAGRRLWAETEGGKEKERETGRIKLLG